MCGVRSRHSSSEAGGSQPPVLMSHTRCSVIESPNLATTQRPAGGVYPPADQGGTMTRTANPRPRLPKRPSPDNFDPGVLIALLYDDLVEVEALAVTAEEAVTNRPPRPRGRVRPAPGPPVHARGQDVRARAGRPGARSWSPCTRPTGRHRPPNGHRHAGRADLGA